MVNQEPRWNDYYAMQQRAELAEAEVERLRLTIESLWATEPWQIADDLAEALKALRRKVGPIRREEQEAINIQVVVALAHYEEARRGS